MCAWAKRDDLVRWRSTARQTRQGAFQARYRQTRSTYSMSRRPVCTFFDIEHLLHVLHRLRDRGNTVVVIEHNLDVIKTADWVIDLGPEGGDGGGQVVAIGTPQQVANTKGSFTGEYLKPLIENGRRSHAVAATKD